MTSIIITQEKRGLKRKTGCYLYVVRFLNSFILGLDFCQFWVIILIRIDLIDVDSLYVAYILPKIKPLDDINRAFEWWQGSWRLHAHMCTFVHVPVSKYKENHWHGVKLKSKVRLLPEQFWGVEERLAYHSQATRDTN